jgi:citrate synthase
LRRRVKAAIHKYSEAQDYVAQSPSGSFATQFTQMLHGKITHAAISFLYIKARAGA